MIQPVKYNKEVKKQLCDRKSVYSDEVEKAVKTILCDVKQNGDNALKFYTQKFDGIVPENFLVSEKEIEEALNNIDDDYIKVLERSAANIRSFHEKQVRTGFKTECDGCVTGQKVTPVKCAGIYVPGGTAAYPSTVLMKIGRAHV